jgi:hypothetical protein
MNAMNENTPPIDPAIREQLARRSAGRLPEGLLTEVTTALDLAPAARAAARWPRLAWTAPRLAGTAVAVAFVAIFVAAIALPGWRTGPAATSGTSPVGYPAERALTTAELAPVLAGPALATNTTLVAFVTIQTKTDICPMDRYPTIGVIEGMDSQVCVMGATLGLDASTPTASGTFAFRYLAPGYLGIISQITPAALQLSYGVSDVWPLDGKTFLVDGWLGATGLLVACPADTPDPGDPLAPNGSDCGYDDWLGESSTAPGIDSDNAYNAYSPAPSYDPLSLRGDARHVEAGGARLIDSISAAAPVLGVYVVRSVSEGCAGDPVTSSRGCGAWRVLARVSDITIPGPVATASAEPSTPLSATPSARETPIAYPSPSAQSSPTVQPTLASTIPPTGLIGPNNQPLTQTQLAALIAADPNRLAGRYVIDKRVTCDGIGSCAGVPPKVLADLVQTDGSLGLVGPVDIRPDGGLVWTVPEALVDYPGRFIFILDATMISDGTTTWLDSDASAELTAQDGAFSQFAPVGTPHSSGVQGLFLVSNVNEGKTCGTGPPASSGACSAHVEILARLETATTP